MTITVDITIQHPAWNTHDWGIKDSLHAHIVHAIKTTIALFDMGMCEVSVVLANDSFVQDLNNTYRHTDKPTNVLSFPARDKYMMADMVENLGDIIISYDTLIQQSETQCKTPLSHCIHLVVHGMLHLLGFDHQTDDKAEQMEDLERFILAKMQIGDPYFNALVDAL